MDGVNHHRLLECMGCETVFYHLSASDSESWDFRYNPITEKEEVFYPITITTYPATPKEERPDWTWSLVSIDSSLYEIMNEVYDAQKGNSLILAAVGLRTALDRTAVILKIDPGHTLEDKLEKLIELGYVGGQELEVLKIVIDAGSAAAHRGWSPNDKEFKNLLTALEQFIHRAVVIGQEPLGIAKSIPAKQPRPRKNKKN